MNQEQVFIKMNQDTHPRYMAKGDYRYALNCRVGLSVDGSDLSVNNIQGTETCTHYRIWQGFEYNTGLPTSGINKIIGSVEWEQEGRLAIFVWNSLNQHCIFMYDDEDFSIYKIIESNLLNFSDDHQRLITGCAFIHDDLYFTDSNGEVKHINLIDIKKYTSYISIPIDAITLIRRPPIIAPKITRKQDNVVISSTIKGKSFQFATRYVFADGSRSVFSSASELAFHVKPDSTDSYSVTHFLNGSNDNFKNIINSVEFIYRESYTLNWKIFKSVLFNTVTDNQIELSVDFKNDGAFSFVDNADANRLYDTIPVKVKALEYLEDRLFVGNFKDSWGDNLIKIVKDALSNINLIEVDNSTSLQPLGAVDTFGNTQLKYSNNATFGQRVFKPDSTYGIGIVLYDEYRRKTLVLGYDQLTIKTNQQQYSIANRTFRSFTINPSQIALDLKNPLININSSEYDLKEYAIVRTENLTTNWFVQGRVENVYYVLYVDNNDIPVFINKGLSKPTNVENYNDVINNAYLYVNYQSDSLAVSLSSEIWFDTRNWTLYGTKLPYSFTEGDILTVIQRDLKNTVKSLDKYKIKKQRGFFIIVDKDVILPTLNLKLNSGISNNLVGSNSDFYHLRNTGKQLEFIYDFTKDAIKVSGNIDLSVYLLKDKRTVYIKTSNPIYDTIKYFSENIVDVYCGSGITNASNGAFIIAAKENGEIVLFENTYSPILLKIVNGIPLQVCGTWNNSSAVSGTMGISYLENNKISFEVFDVNNVNGTIKKYINQGSCLVQDTNSDTVMYGDYLYRFQDDRQDSLGNHHHENDRYFYYKNCLGFYNLSEITSMTIYNSFHLSEVLVDDSYSPNKEGGLLISFQVDYSAPRVVDFNGLEDGIIQNRTIGQCHISNTNKIFLYKSSVLEREQPNTFRGTGIWHTVYADDLIPPDIQILDSSGVFRTFNDGNNADIPDRGGIFSMVYKSNILDNTPNKTTFYNRSVVGAVPTYVWNWIFIDNTISGNGTTDRAIRSSSILFLNTDVEHDTTVTPIGKVKDYKTWLVISDFMQISFLDTLGNSVYWKLNQTTIPGIYHNYSIDTINYNQGTKHDIATAYNYGCKIEISSPRKPVDTNLYYEVGNPHIYTNVSATNQEVRFGDSDDGDCFIIEKEFRGYWWDMPKPDIILSMNPDPNNIIEWIKVNSAINTELKPSKIINADYDSAIRFGGQYLSGTNINDINIFNALDEKIMPNEYGSIMKLQNTSNTLEDGNVLLAVMTEETVSIYVNKVQFNDVSGQNLVATADTVLGTFRALRGSYGTRHPESVVQYNGNVYFFDWTKGEVLQYSTNGLDSIANKGMRTYWNNITAIINKSIAVGDKRADNFYIYGGVDSDNGDILFTIIENKLTLPLKETLSYTPSSQSWGSFYSFVPNGYGKVNNRMIGLSIVSNNFVHLFNANETRSTTPIKNNTFFGQTYDSVLVTVFNQFPNENKNPLNITIQSDECWEVQRIESDNVVNGTASNSECLKGDMDQIDQTWYGAILRDASTPITNPLIEGDVMIGKYFLVKLVNKSSFNNVVTNTARLYKAILSFVKSYY